MHDGTLPINEMRGFVAEHPDAPAIVVNTRDDPRARVFTILHELGHLWLATSGVRAPNPEAWCEDFAGQVLMPRALAENALARLMAGRASHIAAVDGVALVFGVTPRAAAVRLSLYGLLSKKIVSEVLQEIGERAGPAGSSGGDYYRTQIARLGPSFIRLVFSALDGQAVTYPVASTLLDVKASNFEKLRGYLDQRAAIE